MVVEKVGGLDIAMEDARLMDVPEAVEKTAEVVSHVVDEKVSVVEAEVQVSEVWQHGDHLIQMTEGCQQRAYVWRVS
jgi:hypothetical protein